jgi:hypothetical protein
MRTLHADTRARANSAVTSLTPPRFPFPVSRPLANRGDINLTDPFLGDMMGYMHCDEGAPRP